MRKWCISLILASAALWSVPGEAQPTTVDINKAKFTWSWTQGTGGTATGFRFTCTFNGGATPIVKTLADGTARTAPLSIVATGEGDYVCTLAAYNDGGASAESNSVSFRAAKMPVSPTGFAVSPQ